MKIFFTIIFLLGLFSARAEAVTTNVLETPLTERMDGKKAEVTESVSTESAEDAALRKARNAPPVYPTCVRVEPDVAYLGTNRDEKADIYSPLHLRVGERLPAILIIHGGGFNDGDKARPREINFATNLVLNGYICMSINYELRKRQGEVTWPQCLYDAKAAVRWLRKNAAAWQINPDRIGVIGGSAGGNLAAMLALTQPKDGFDLPEPYGEFSAAVNCAVDFYGAVKLMAYHDMKMFNRTRAEAPALYEKASPVNYAHKDAPPLLIVHGTADTTVPLAQSRALAEALTKAGAENQLVVVPDAPHTFHLQPKQCDLRPLVLGFFDRHLKNGSAVMDGSAVSHQTAIKVVNP
jgi:acetyl esterase/lipase